MRRSAALNSAGRDTEDGFLLDYFLTALQGLEEDKPSSKVSQLLKLHLLMDQSRKTLEKIEELRLSAEPTMESQYDAAKPRDSNQHLFY